MTAFIEFAQACERLQTTSKRLEKIALLGEFLRKQNREELPIVALFFLGKAFPDNDPRTLDVSWRTLQSLLDKNSQAKRSKAPNIIDVAEAFTQIADSSGKGSRKRILELLGSLFNKLSELERKYLLRVIFGEMRIGVAEGILLESIAKAWDVPLKQVRRANMYLGHPGEVAKIVLTGGPAGLSQVRLKLFRPVQPMLAGLAEEFSAVLDEHGGTTALEFKFDGARVQIHKQGHDVRIYSRHLTEVTSSLPDVVEMIRKHVIANSLIVEGEVVAVGKNGRPLPFQELMRRFRRVHEIDTLTRKVPLHLYLFDLLFLNGEPQVDCPYKIRIELLQNSADSIILADRLVTSDAAEGEAFLKKALEQGHEGLMAKSLDSDYVPGTRGKRWFKIKPTETLDIVVIAADWGSGRRVGWLSNYHLAVRDPGTGEHLDLGKTFKGLTDKQFQWMTEKLLSLKVRETDYTVFVKPEVVVEVAFNEIQRSPRYNSKFALRFARIKRIREDKSLEQADTISRVRSMFEQQFERKAKG